MSKPNVTVSSEWVAAALLIIAFWGEPDLVDAVIYHFTGEQDGWSEAGE